MEPHRRVRLVGINKCRSRTRGGRRSSPLRWRLQSHRSTYDASAGGTSADADDIDPADGLRTSRPSTSAEPGTRRGTTWCPGRYGACWHLPGAEKKAGGPTGRARRLFLTRTTVRRMLAAPPSRLNRSIRPRACAVGARSFVTPTSLPAFLQASGTEAWGSL